jgi:L-lactate dehydrogenase (cytochrome)
VGIAGMYRRRGETQTATAAKPGGIPFPLPTVSLCSLAEVVGVAGPIHIWFQLYVIKDRAFMRDMLCTAMDLGARTLVLMVDVPVPGATRRGVYRAREPGRRLA